MVVTLLLLSLQLPLSLLPLLSLLLPLLSLPSLSVLLLLSAAAGAARILEAKLGAVELQLPLSLLPLLSLLLLLLSAATGAAVMMERACRPICPTWVNRPNPMAASRP